MRLRAATHESGHALVTEALGLRVREIWITADGLSGRTLVDNASRVEMGRIAAAGRVAEELVLGSALIRASKSDLAKVEIYGTWEEAAAGAREILTPRIPLVHQMRVKLLERGRLTGSEVRRVAYAFPCHGCDIFTAYEETGARGAAWYCLSDGCRAPAPLAVQCPGCEHPASWGGPPGARGWYCTRMSCSHRVRIEALAPTRSGPMMAV